MNTFDTSDASNLEKKCEKAVRKRRSSIFQTRTFAFDGCEENEKPVDNNDATECRPEAVQEEIFDLEKYVHSLKEERKMWLEKWKERKAQRRSLMRQKSGLECQGQTLNLNVLSDSERAFVMARPNYEQIYKTSKRLSDVATKVKKLNELVYKLNHRFILRMEQRLGDVTKRIIEMSES